jgi:Tol biopolymer transport system component
VIFGTTVGPPTESAPPGYQRSTGRYRWMFPPEMRIVQVHLDAADGTESSLETLVKADAYLAECSLSRDGRHLLYCSLERGGGDIMVRDLTTGISRTIIPNEGYDGGPFFSPDGKRICYRSDRRGNHLLQLFVADLSFDETGAIIGIEREYQLTDNEHVNWCPFWLPSGRHLIYGTSEVGHSNYEVFLIDADPGNLPGSSGSIKYGAGLRRVTNASGADVLPALSSDGKTMVWTSQRGDAHTSQLWVADFVLDPDAAPDLSQYDPSSHRPTGGSTSGTSPGSSPHPSGSGGGERR